MEQEQEEKEIYTVTINKPEDQEGMPVPYYGYKVQDHEGNNIGDLIELNISVTVDSLFPTVTMKKMDGEELSGLVNIVQG